MGVGIIGESNIKYGNNKFLKFLKKNIFFCFKIEFFNNKNNGPNPIKITKKYLSKTSKEYLPKFP